MGLVNKPQEEEKEGKERGELCCAGRLMKFKLKWLTKQSEPSS